MTERCEYTVTYADFLASVAIWRKHNWRAAAFYRIYVWVLPVCAVIFVGVWGALLYRQGAHSVTDLLILGAGIGFAIGVPNLYRVAMRRLFSLRNVLAQNKPIIFEFDEERARFLVPGGTEVIYPWSAITNFSQGAHVAILLIGQSQFHTLPLRALTARQLSSIQSFVSSKEGRS